MTTETREFDLGTVLSVTTPYLMSPNGISDIHAILNWMTQDDLFTHQLPRAFRECQPWLRRQHPALTELDGEIETFCKTRVQALSDKGQINRLLSEWLTEKAATYGGSFAVSPIPRDDHEVIDPEVEAVAMVGKGKVIKVERPLGGAA